MWWDKVLEWFSNNRERNELIADFNRSAKEAFVASIVPVYLKAESSRGNSAFNHQFSSFLYHGFRIRTLTGMFQSDDLFIAIGNMLAANQALTRHLVTLGYDTLEITNNQGRIVKQWRLSAMLEIT
jgi:hypothetical protein